MYSELLFSVPANCCLQNFSATKLLGEPIQNPALEEETGWPLQNKTKSQPTAKQYLIVYALLCIFLQTPLSCSRQGTPKEPCSSVVCSCIVSNLKPCNLFNVISLLSLQNLCEKYPRSLDLLFSQICFEQHAWNMCFMCYISSVLYFLFDIQCVNFSYN